MANENSKAPTQAKPQMIPLSKIHELPGVFNPKPQDKLLGSMVLSIESSGVKEAVILRQRSDGEYELLSGYFIFDRRRTVCPKYGSERKAIRSRERPAKKTAR